MQRMLTEKEAEDFLRAEGFKIVKGGVAKTEQEILDLSKKIKFPWAMKASSPKIVHKKKLGAIILNVNNQMQAQEAFDKLAQVENFQECIIQEMIAGEELIIGIKKTPEFGQVLMVGKGGPNVEEEKDISFRVLPVSRKEMDDMVKELKFYKMLEEKHADIQLIKDALGKAASLAKKYPNILELDINPLILTPKKAEVVDARIIFED